MIREEKTAETLQSEESTVSVFIESSKKSSMVSISAPLVYVTAICSSRQCNQL
jgi:hypothetical protein